MLNLPEHAPEDEPIFSAAELLAQRWSRGGAPKVLPPHTIIIGYQRAAIDALLKRYRHVKVAGFFGDVQLLKTRGQPLGVLQPVGPGAPIVAAALEELIAFGVRRFVSIGLAGGLSSDLRAGDVVIADRALRDEGTSYHYLPPAPSVEADRAGAGYPCSVVCAQSRSFHRRKLDDRCALSRDTPRGGSAS
jgi:hypothetical protein